MAIKINVSLEFVDLGIGDKVLFGKKVARCLSTETKTFNNLPIPLDILLGTNNALDDAQQEAMSGDSVAMEKRNKLNKLWNSQFRRTAAYVSFIADGDAELIKSTGFLCTKGTRQRKGKIEIIDNFTADVQTAKGTADVSCQRVKDATGYVMIAADEKATVSLLGDDILVEMNGVQVRLKLCTQSSGTFTDLPSKTTVGISMAAFNSAGISPLTDAQSITPQ